MLYLLVGLGNIGTEYEHTRHNVGFDIIDSMSSKFDQTSFNNKFKGQFLKISLKKYELLLLKPSTYMNNSGISVAEAANFYKIANDKVIVIHDDIDLACGKVKMKIGGGHGGHNGLKSVDSLIGQDYWRIRVGVSKPLDRMDVSDYVIKKFTKDQQLIIDSTISKITDNIEAFLETGKDKFLSLIHT